LLSNLQTIYVLVVLLFNLFILNYRFLLFKFIFMLGVCLMQIFWNHLILLIKLVRLFNLCFETLIDFQKMKILNEIHRLRSLEACLYIDELVLIKLVNSFIIYRIRTLFSILYILFIFYIRCQFKQLNKWLLSVDISFNWALDSRTI